MKNYRTPKTKGQTQKKSSFQASPYRPGFLHAVLGIVWRPFHFCLSLSQTKGVKLSFSPIFEVRRQSTIVLGMLAPITWTLNFVFHAADTGFARELFWYVLVTLLQGATDSRIVHGGTSFVSFKTHRVPPVTAAYITCTQLQRIL